MPEPWLASRLPRLGVTPLPVTWQDTTAVSALPPLHRDPFDRLLVAQARRHDLVLATADRLVTQYDVRLLPVG
ncbi:MAG: type II toxin-antitoxin system VapC family toxin [Actinomycetota bacterium]|nr:type II toxin-antitoxin system VapC family toxin [Actinomycetota bacterium]